LHVVVSPLRLYQNSYRDYLLSYSSLPFHTTPQRNSDTMSDEAVFDNLPKYDPSKFQPPAWATGPQFDYTRKNGESSKSAHTPSNDSGNRSNNSTHDLDDPESDEEVWEDAQDDLEAGVEETPGGLAFTVPELKVSRRLPTKLVYLSMMKLMTRNSSIELI
jgi:hypothetical protein